MTIFKLAQHVETERENNATLAEKIDAIEASGIAEDEQEIAQLEALLANKRSRLERRKNCKVVIKEEFVSRDQALANIIGEE